jgi:hypothetical protein
MDDNVLAVGTLEGADGLHERATRAGAVAGAAVVNVARVETERAVIAMMAATGQWANEFVAVAALEALVEGVTLATAGIALGNFVRRHAGGPGAAILPSGATDTVAGWVAWGFAATGCVACVAFVARVAPGRVRWLCCVGRASDGLIVLVCWHVFYLLYG